MPPWLENILSSFLSDQEFIGQKTEFSQGYAKAKLNNVGDFEMNFFPHDESILFSLRLVHRLDETLLARMLRSNDYRRRRALMPTGHVFRDSIVLRVLMQREQIETSNLVFALENLKRTNRELIGA